MKNKNKKLIILAIIITGFLVISSILFFILKEELVIDKDWDVSCGETGVGGYQAEILEYDIPEIPLERGKIITVTTDSDAVNGDVSSYEALLKNSGPDGISLREAMKTTSISSGEYTINFAEHLKGTEIEVGSWNESFLPYLDGGNVIINGDITNDGNPDIIIKNSLEKDQRKDYVAFNISSSRNVISALEIHGFDFGIIFSPEGKENTIFTDNIISNVIMRDINKKGIVLFPRVPLPPAEEILVINNKWLNTTIINNDIEAVTGGARFHIKDVAGNKMENTKIINNRIVMKGARFATGIEFVGGSWGSSRNNEIIDTIIADNEIILKGSEDATGGIRMASGDNGASGNLVDNAVIANNKIEAKLGDDDTPVVVGIFLSSGDSSTRHDKPDYRPIIYPENNMLQNVKVIGNDIKGFINHGIYVMTGINGAKYNYVEDVSILGNFVDINPSYLEHASRPGGIGLYSGPIGRDWEDPIGRSSTDNVLSDTIIKWNTIKLADPHHLFKAELYYIPDDPKGIIIHEYKKENNKIENIDLSYNLLKGEGILADIEKIDRECNKIEIK